MKRVIACGLLMAMLLSLCGCSLLKPKIERYAKEGWEQIGDRDAEPEEIYVIQYTSRKKLSDEVLDTEMYDDIPERGYAVLYHSYARDPFSDSYACFFDDEGELEFVFDYEENDLLFEKYYEDFSIYNIGSGEKALEYITNCNYISGMINYASDGEDFTSNMEKNIWYALSDAQIAWVAG